MLHLVKDNGTNLHTSIHWLASRALLQQLYQGKTIELHKDEFNKPSLSIDGAPYFISISHSNDYAVIIVSHENQVAIDIEKIDERVIRVAHKFIRDDEQVPSAAFQTMAYTIIWSAKETLYKHYGKKELDFKQHLSIEPFGQVSGSFDIRGHIRKGAYNECLEIRVATFDEYILTYIV